MENQFFERVQSFIKQNIKTEKKFPKEMKRIGYQFYEHSPYVVQQIHTRQNYDYFCE
jgi:hypothetical protein